MTIIKRILYIWRLLPYERRRKLMSYAISYDMSVSDVMNALKIQGDEYLRRVDGKPKSRLRALYRLEEVLIDHLFEFNHLKRGNEGKKRLKILKEYTQLRLFEEMSHTTLFLYYAKRLLKRTINLGMDDITLLISERIVYQYSFISINKAQVRIYEDLYESSLEKLELKKSLSRNYYWLVQRIVTQKTESTADELEEIRLKLEQQNSLLHTPINHLHASRILSSSYFYHLLNRDTKKMISICEEALTYFSEKFPYREVEQYMFTLRLGVAYLYAGDNDNARLHIEKCVNMKPSTGTIHWNSTYSYYFTLEMLTKNYQKAADILVKTTTSKEIKRLNDMWLQQWRIRSAYIHFLAKIGEVDLMQYGRRRVPNFKLGKFLNEVPLYAKDKRGLNISIIIAQILILLADKKWEKIHDRVESLRKYSYRHFKNDGAVRSNSFIRMLLALVKADFNPIRAERYAETYRSRLGTTQMNLNEYSTEIEIIPYEDLWETILILTDVKKQRRKRAK